MTGEVEYTGEITGSVKTGEIGMGKMIESVEMCEIIESVEMGLVIVSEIKATLFNSIRYSRLPINSPAKTRSLLFCLTKTFLLAISQMYLVLNLFHTIKL